MSISDLKIVQVAVEKTEERVQAEARAETEEKVKAVMAETEEKSKIDKIETIKRMRAKGLEFPIICDVLNLQEKEVEEYLKEA